jgi:hypothetical protein
MCIAMASQIALLFTIWWKVKTHRLICGGQSKVPPHNIVASHFKWRRVKHKNFERVALPLKRAVK